MKEDDIKYYTPHPVLKPFIHHYICFKNTPSRNNQSFTLFPSNYPILCFDIERKHFKLADNQLFNYIACFLGVSSKSSHFEKLAEEVIQIVFKPYGVFNIFGISQCPLANTILDASSIFSQMAVLTRKLEAEYTDSFLQVKKIENWLLKTLSLKTKLHYQSIMLACEKIEKSSGTLPLKSLYKTVGMSERSFRNHFTEQTGVSPKTFSRIARFNKINSLLTNHTDSIDWQELIFKFGFFDQTHFINECKWFYGNTPTHLLKMQPRSLNAIFFKSAL